MRHDDLSVGLETTQASVIVRRSAQKSSTMRGSQARLPLDSGKTRLNDVNTYKQITRLQSTQNKHRPSPANATDLRLGGAVTSCMCMLIRTYGHGHACTGMRTLSWARARPWSYLHGHVHGHGHARTVTHMHGHSHTFTGYVHGHASDETSVRLTQIKLQPSSLKCPAAA